MALASRHLLASSLEERLSGLEIAFRTAFWDSQVDVSPESERRRADAELDLRRAKGDPEALRSVTVALDEEFHDPVLRRQLEVLRLSLTGNQMDDALRARIVELSSSIEADFAAYRPEVDGRALSENDIVEILRSEQDESVRRRAWEASKEVGALVAERLRELARMRNDVAHGVGFADYYRMSLELQEIPEAWLFGIMDDLERLSDGPYRAWKSEIDETLRGRFGVDDLYPWHYADPFFQQLPPDGAPDIDDVLGEASAVDMAQRTFAAWGIDLASVMRASDLFPRDRKSQHAFCLDVDRTGEDVRILANVVPGERWMEVMLHESGHAAYDISIGRDVPYLLHRPAHIFVTEAIAVLSGDFVRDKTWLVEIGGIAEADIAPMEAALRRAATAQKLLFSRWGLVMVHFERELYSDPEGDLDALWWDLVQRFQLVDPPRGRVAPDWAAKVHVATAPVYYHNYLLGELLASQLSSTCERDCGGVVAVSEAGRLLIERVFRPGALMRWDALVEEATGRPLSTDDFARDIAL